MIKFNDVLKLAVLVFDDDELKRLTVSVAQRDWIKADRIINEAHASIESETLSSVYNGDCDLAVFDHYKKIKNLYELYHEYKDEAYAIGT